MTAIPRGPYEFSLRRRLQAFFDDNPDEWLTWDDLCTKFGCSKKQAEAAMYALRQEGNALEVISVIRRGPDA